jgi:hypothetical protein
LVRAAGVEPLVRAACDVAGSSSPALDVLAGLSEHADPYDIETERVVYNALEEMRGHFAGAYRE